MSVSLDTASGGMEIPPVSGSRTTSKPSSVSALVRASMSATFSSGGVELIMMCAVFLLSG